MFLEIQPRERSFTPSKISQSLIFSFLKIIVENCLSKYFSTKKSTARDTVTSMLCSHRFLIPWTNIAENRGINSH